MPPRVHHRKGPVPTSRRASAYLLRSKLAPPHLSVSQVLRAVLCERICNGAAENLVLIHAPAGFGKTTLMLQARDALQHLGVRTAWLNADAADNDVSRFLGFLSAAVAVITSQSREPDATGATSGAMAALDLLDTIAAVATPFALFIDNFEAMHSATSCALLRQVIEELPAHGRVIIGSRRNADLGVARLRAQGQLLEIQAIDLRFSLSETEDFLLAQRGLGLELAEVARLQRVTEGWPVALRLASLALERCEQPTEFAARFSASNVSVAEYLAQEILARLSAPMREFMLRTSLLSHLNAQLCDAMLGVGNSAEVLDELERTGLLVQPLSQERDWFRYHSLFASFLRTQLERLHPQELPRLHRAAAHWYEVQQRPIPAIEHALASGDAGYALPLLDQHAEQLLQDGRVRLLLRLLDSVAPQDLSHWPRLRLMQAWALSMTRGGGQAMQLLDRIEAETRLDAESRAHALALRPMLLTMLDRFDAAYASARAALDDVRPTHAFPFSILRTTLANLHLVKGRYASARDLLDKSQALQRAPRGPFMTIFAQCVNGAIDLLHGRLQEATARFRESAGVGTRCTFTHTNGNAMAGLLLAEALYEQNELNDAERLLKLYVPLMEEIGLTDHLICGHRDLARIAFHRGDRDRAQQLVTHMEFLGHQRGLPRLVASAYLERARLALWQDDSGTAREALQRAKVTLDWSEIADRALFGNDADTLVEGQLRWMIHGGSAAEAIPRLKQEMERADGALRQRRALRMRILLALALDRNGNHKQALRILRTAVRFARRERFVRAFLDEGEAGLQLLGKLAAAQPGAAAPLSVEALQRFLLADATPPEPSAQAVPSVANTADVTHREIEILRLVAEGLPNLGIAERLVISESTVRTHLRSINTKLHTGNRTQAIRLARQMKLIE